MRLAARLFIILAVLSLAPLPAPVSAQSGWETGVYSGWVYVKARLSKHHDIQAQGTSVVQDTVVYWQAHGDVTFEVAAPDQGRVSVYLPYEITAQENGRISGGVNCSFNIAARGDLPAQNVAELVPTPLGDEIQRDLITSYVRASLANQSISGQCGNMADSSLFINDTIKNTSRKLNTIRLRVGYRGPLSVGGDCDLGEWGGSLAIPNGKIDMQVESCEWRAFRELEGGRP